jgi:hypothetical protein
VLFVQIDDAVEAMRTGQFFRREPKKHLDVVNFLSQRHRECSERGLEPVTNLLRTHPDFTPLWGPLERSYPKRGPGWTTHTVTEGM